MKDSIEIYSDEDKGILGQAQSLFDNEKHLAREPFFFEGKNGKGILLIHGWTSTPYEVRKLGEFLNSSGYTVYGLLLSGHGKEPFDLENIKWQSWINDIEIAYTRLREKCNEVYLGGTSLGAVLSIIFASKKKSVSGIVLMAMPYRLKMEWLIEFISRTSLFLGKKYWKKFYPKSFGSSGLVTRLVSYQKYPTANGIESTRAIKEARKKLPDVVCPCFILQSTHDHIVDPGSMDKIYEKIGSKIKSKKSIQKAYHTFIADIDRGGIFQDILNFLNKN